MTHLAEPRDATPPRARVPWPAVIAVTGTIAAWSVAGLIGYHRDQTDLRVQDAKAATVQEVEGLRAKDAEFGAAIAVLQAQRAEDSERLKRIEAMLTEVLREPRVKR